MKKVYFFVFLLLWIALSTEGIRILLTNGNGWAERNVRLLNDALRSRGHDVILSAPAQDGNRLGCSQKEPKSRKKRCQFKSCPKNAGPEGFNKSDPDLHWVNSTPATALKYGLDKYCPAKWGPGEKPDLVISGINVGDNRFVEVKSSGTVGAAVIAANQYGLPAIAIHGEYKHHGRWNGPKDSRNASHIYAELAMQVIDTLVDTGKPYMLNNTFLNVNIPRVETFMCKKATDFKWMFTRINTKIGKHDVHWCNADVLDTEIGAWQAYNCSGSVSVGEGDKKDTGNRMEQKFVLDKLHDLFYCRRH